MLLKLDGWKTNIRFSSAHLLPGHDQCGVLHGHTYAIHAHIEGEPTKEGMVLDFSHVKTTLRSIADSLDHCFLLPKDNSAVMINDHDVRIESNKKSYTIPKQDCRLLPMKEVTAEQLALYVLDRFLTDFHIPKNVSVVRIGIDDGFGQGAWVEKSFG